MSRARSLLGLALSAAVACTAPASRPVHLVIDDAAYVFDTVYGPPVMHHFLVRNDGDEPTGPLGVELHGDTHSFTVAQNGCTGLTGRGQCTVDVAFADETAGDYRAELIVRAAAPGVLASAQMSGRVSPAAFAVKPGATPLIRGNASPLAVTISDAGGARTGVMKLAVTGASVAFDPCSGTALHGGESCVVDLIVTAPLHGAFATAPALTISDDDGHALSTTLDVTLADPGALNFAGLQLGSIDPSVQAGEVTIANPNPYATAPLALAFADDVTDPALAGAPLFTVDSVADHCSGVKLAPQTACTVFVLPNPSTTDGRSYSAHLTVSAANLDEASATITFTAVHKSAQVTIMRAGTGGAIVAWGREVCATSGSYQCERFRVLDGESVSFSVVPSPGSTFAGWSGGGCGASNVCSFKVHDGQDITLTATFQ